MRREETVETEGDGGGGLAFNQDTGHGVLFAFKS